MNLKFYLTSTATFLITSILGFITGGEVLYNLIISQFGKPRNEELFAYSLYMTLGAFLGVFVAFVVSLIIIHRLGRRWGSQLSFGDHSVLKLTALSFFTYVALLIVILNINYYFGK